MQSLKKQAAKASPSDGQIKARKELERRRLAKVKASRQARARSPFGAVAPAELAAVLGGDRAGGGGERADNPALVMPCYLRTSHIYIYMYIKTGYDKVA